MRLFWKKIIVLAIFCVLSSADLSFSAANPLSARDVFIRLPESIFESTEEGLTEQDKNDLLNCGRSEFWEIIQETPDDMIFSSLPFGEKTVGLRLYRNDEDGSVNIAAGPMDEAVCTVEFWKSDVHGRLVPVEGPEEPPVGEFFKKGAKIPGKAQTTILICLDTEGIVAKPVFWNKKGILDVPVDNQILFNWQNGKFSKEIRPKR